MIDNRQHQEELLQLLEELERRKKSNKISFSYPDSGKFSRSQYSKHIETFNATKENQEIIFMAGNRCGKTFTGAHLVAYCATGLYPIWWTGRRFDRPIKIWACGKTGSTTRDIVQKELLGEYNEIGSGTIPKSNIDGRPKSKPGIPDGIETVHVKHVSGGTSVITFKSYDSGVSAFVGTAMDLIWMDELPDDPKIYLECQVRLMTTKGLSIVTATPDKGMSPTVLAFWPDGKIKWGSLGNGKYCVNMTWDEAPHIDQGEQERLIAQMLPHEKEAKIKGIPYLGSGQVYPILEEDYSCKPFEIPRNWLKCAGLDVGWNRTACVWFATNPADGVSYIYSEHYRGQAEPSVHAQGIKARGPWIPIAIDPAARGRSQDNGLQLIELYAELGLDVFKANNEVEAGILAVFDRLSSGKLKIFTTCENLLAEMRLYRRDEMGKILKKNDHACDAMRYGVMSALDCAIKEPMDRDSDDSLQHVNRMPDKMTGY